MEKRKRKRVRIVILCAAAGYLLTMLLLDDANLDAPVILACTADALYPGMEVRLGGVA